MVERRCAITKLVRFSMMASIARTMACSVRVSTDEVASSRIRIAGSQSMARAMVSSCRWPWLTFSASDVSTVSYPSGSVLTKKSTCAARAAASISSRVASGFP